ncbi:MAG: glycosyltransferase family 4 protein [Fibrobacter sp.]|nr:glycosyltransferase family 4 protein [Fibrobacter sp.]
MITLDFPPEHGGIQKYLYNIVKHTFEVNDTVAVGYSRKHDFHDPDIKCKVSFFSTLPSIINKKFSLIPLTLFLLRTIKKNPSNTVIECGNIYAAIAPFALSFILNVNYDVFCYGKELLIFRKKTLKSRFLRLVLNRAQKLYYISTYTKDLISKIVPKANMCYFPPKIEIPCFSNNTPPKKSSDILHLLSVGRLVAHKGHKYLIQAVNDLPKTFKWELTIAGSGPCEKSLKRLVKKLNLDNNILIKTSLDNNELTHEYQKADIFVFPSFESRSGTEGFGVVLLEAMAYKLPIIASRTGGVTDVAGNGQYGLCVKPQCPEEITDAILKLANNPQLCKVLTSNAHSNLIKNYVW